MYTLDVGRVLGPSYVAVAEDIFRTLTIQIVVQILLSVIDQESGFFSPVFWLILAYVILGTLVYHLVLKNVFEII